MIIILNWSQGTVLQIYFSCWTAIISIFE